MRMNLNPMILAEQELDKLLAAGGDMRPALIKLIHDTVERERLMVDAHPQCGADNPAGKVSLCACHCHKGHYKHQWQQMTKSPTQDADGTFHILYNCRYCPDVRLKVITSKWVNEKRRVIAQEFIIRGEHRVLAKEEFFERAPQLVTPEMVREARL